MKILIVTDTYYPRVNGVAKSIKSFYDEYVKNGHEVAILAPDYEVPMHAMSEEFDRDLVVRVRANKIKFSPEDRLPVIDRETRRIVKNAFNRFKPDVVHTQTPFTLGIYVAKEAKKRGIPLVHTYHTFFEAYLPLYFKWIPKFMHKFVSRVFSRWFCNLHDVIVAPSTSMRDVLKSYGITSDVRVIPTGIDIKPYARGNRNKGRKSLGVKPTSFVMLTVGRVAHEKNLPFLLDVLEQAKQCFIDMRLVIAGQGPALESIKAEVLERGLERSVTYVGLLSTELLTNLYAAADVFVLASKTETQGLVLIESLASGTPCVAVAEMGVKDFNDDVSLVDYYTDSFLDRVMEISTYPRKVMERKSKKAAKHWTSEVMAKRMLDRYKILIDE